MSSKKEMKLAVRARVCYNLDRKEMWPRYISSLKARDLGYSSAREAAFLVRRVLVATIEVGLGCLLVSTLPFLAYSIVCLNPMKSDFNNAEVDNK
ncbi:hypothetical protein OSTOST_18826 [Ostertagia ostertagi]